MYTVMNFRVCNLSLIDVMEILLSRSKQYGNENKTNGQWMKKTILFFLLIFLFIMRVASQSEKSILEVKGCVIDIIEVKYGATVFPQGGSMLKYGISTPKCILGKESALSIMDMDGPYQVRSSQKCSILAAVDHLDVDSREGWIPTGEKIVIASTGIQLNYYLYQYDYITPGEWVNVPSPSEKGTTTIIYGDKITVSEVMQPPGTVIAKVAHLKKESVTNPAILVLPNGDYLVACSGVFVKSGEKSGVTYFCSKDKGKTWKVLSENNGYISFYNLFMHDDVLYSMGTEGWGGNSRNVIIRRSDDGGISWTFPRDFLSEGVIKCGKFSTAPVPVVIYNGRIWRAMETGVKGEVPRAFVMSAPIDSNLMKAESWVSTNGIAFNSEWFDKKLVVKQWVEGNVVIAPNGKLVDVIRVDNWTNGNMAAILTVEDSNTLVFNPKEDIINFPGGGKKFTIRYDTISGKYWAMTNPVFEQDKKKKHSGIYKKGVPCGLIRNNLALICSSDLRHWEIKDTLIISDNPFFHGFQYADWQFDGKDIVAVLRTAFDEERGLPKRQHDANFLTFMRLCNFRTDKIPTIKINSINNKNQN